MTVSELVHILQSWQELMGGLSGAALGGIMGVWGANVVARDVRRTERRAAVRVVIADLVGFSGFARELDQRFTDLAEDQIADPEHRDKWLMSQLQAYLYAISPMLDHYLPQLFEVDKPGLAEDLMAFSSHYREVRVRVDQAKVTRAGTSPTYASDVQDAFQKARKAADKALNTMLPYVLFPFASPGSEDKMWKRG